MSLDADQAFRLLRNAWREGPAEHAFTRFMDADLSRAAPTMNWFGEHERQIRSSLSRTLRRFATRTPNAITDYGAVEAHLRTVLDMAPAPAAAKKSVLLPIWPMTLEQLRAAVEDPERVTGVRVENPAPRMKEGDARRGYAYYGARAMHAGPPGTRPDSRDDHRGVDGIAWRLAAPEGFPPYPRRGGVYSRDEALAITTWLRDLWPAMREAWQIVLGKDAQIADAGFDSGDVSRATQFSSLLQRFTDFVHGRLPNAEGRSPKQFLGDVLKWARDKLFPELDAIHRFSPHLLEAWPDPDAHLRALLENDITKYRGRDVARAVYHLTPYTVPWMEPLVGKSAKPVDHVWTRPEDDGSFHHKYFPLSQLLALQAENDRAYKKAQQEAQEAGKRDWNLARGLLRDYKGAWTSQGLRKALPGFTLTTEQRSRENAGAYLRGPSNVMVAYGSGRTITAALSELLFGKKGAKGLASDLETVTKTNPARRGLALLDWRVLAADRDGRPVERVARLPRLRWPGLAVWDWCGGPRSSRGRYELMSQHPGTLDTFNTTGFRFRNLAELWKHLETTE